MTGTVPQQFPSPIIAINMNTEKYDGGVCPSLSKRVTVDHSAEFCWHTFSTVNNTKTFSFIKKKLNTIADKLLQ